MTIRSIVFVMRAHDLYKRLEILRADVHPDTTFTIFMHYDLRKEKEDMTVGKEEE